MSDAERTAMEGAAAADGRGHDPHSKAHALPDATLGEKTLDKVDTHSGATDGATEGSDGSPNGSDADSGEGSESSSGLEDEDRELIRENLYRGDSRLRHLQSRADAALVAPGVPSDGSGSHGSGSDGSESDEEPRRKRAAPGELERLFADDDEAAAGREQPAHDAEKEVPESSSDEDLADFIEDEAVHAAPAREARRGARAVLAAAFGGRVPARALDELVAVFGDGSDYLRMVAEDDSDPESREPLDGHANSAGHANFSEFATPADTQNALCDAIDATDAPERFVVARGGAPGGTADERAVDAEAAWIAGRMGVHGAEQHAAVASVVRMLRVHGWEVPVIAAHRKETYRAAGLGLPELWAVHDHAAEWDALERHRRAVLSLVSGAPGDAHDARSDAHSDSHDPHGTDERVLLEKIARLADSSDALSLVAEHVGRASAQPRVSAAAVAFVERLHRILSGDASHDHGAPLPPNATAHGLATHPAAAIALRALLAQHAAVSTAPTARGRAVLAAACAPGSTPAPDGLHAACELRDLGFLALKPASSFAADAFLRLLRLRENGLVDVAWSFGLGTDDGPRTDRVTRAVADAMDGSVDDARAVLAAVAAHLPRILEARLVRAAQEWTGVAVQHALQDRLMGLPYTPEAHGHARHSVREKGRAAKKTHARAPADGFALAVATPDALVIVDGAFGALLVAHDAPWAAEEGTRRAVAALAEHTPSAVLVVAPAKSAYDTLAERIARALAEWEAPPAVLPGEDDVARAAHATKTPETVGLSPPCRAAALSAWRALDPLAAIASLRTHPFCAHDTRSGAEDGSDALLRYALGLAPARHIAERYAVDAVRRAATRALVNVANLVGVRVADCAAPPRSLPRRRAAALLPFVAGLGPHRAARLLRALPAVPSRAALCDAPALLGPVVFANAASFLVFGTGGDADDTSEPLDATRIHPEDYALARKMAADAIGREEGAVREAMRAPDALADLLLDEYGAELVRRGMPDRRIALHDMRAEMAQPYAERRSPVLPPPPGVLFAQWTAETERTLFPGAVRVASVLPRTGAPDVLFAVHALSGASHTPAAPMVGAMPHDTARRELPQGSLRPGTTLRVRVAAIDVFAAVVRVSPATDAGAALLGRVADSEPFFDRHAFEAAVARPKEAALTRPAADTGLPPAVVRHPSFRPVDAAQAAALLAAMREGDAVLRPSASRGPGHATLSWRLDDGPVALVQHVSVAVEGSAATSARPLRVAGEVYDDVDEVLARHVGAVLAALEDVRRAPKFRALPTLAADAQPAAESAAVDALLAAERAAHPGRVPYVLTLSRARPGSVVLSVAAGGRARHETIDVLPAGLRFRGRLFERIEPLVAWFKSRGA